METGKFPEVLKIGKITPIHKKDDPQLLNNYRPVYVIPIFGKIFEKVIYSRLYSFLTSMNIIYDEHFGFCKSNSTTHAINYSINHLFHSKWPNFILKFKSYKLLALYYYVLHNNVIITLLDGNLERTRSQMQRQIQVSLTCPLQFLVLEAEEQCY